MPISALEHYIYCPRQCALIHADGVWSDNPHTVRGTRGHRRADTAFERIERERVVVRAVPLWSERWGLTGRADAVEMHPSGEVVPVEYKIGSKHSNAAEIQLCAQALCLEEMLSTRVSHGAVWYSRPRRRLRVEFDAALRSSTEGAIHAVACVLESGDLPAAPNDARCMQCQLVGYCLPDVVARGVLVSEYTRNEVFECE
ncbi:MAG: CRISPR-associated protein Cas4 [Candidatus Bipolaricaulia bacterium]